RQHMPYELDDGIGYRARIGLIVLATDQTIEYEFRRIMNLPGVALYESRIYNAPTISPESLQDMERGIAKATEVIMPSLPLDVVTYACTSGAMVIGDDKVRARIWEARPGVACTTPMAATFAAFKALHARRICFIAPYVDEICRSMRRYILDNGFGVPVMGSWNLEDDTKVACISENTIGQTVLELGSSDHVDAVFLACTSLRLADRVEALEQELGKPVTSSNHALAWHCLRLAGYKDTVSGFGRLYTRQLA
ncbi:MAG: Asp/Glu racemase, partial [Acidiferrobacterales bacterium]